MFFQNPNVYFKKLLGFEKPNSFFNSGDGVFWFSLNHNLKLLLKVKGTALVNEVFTTPALPLRKVVELCSNILVAVYELTNINIGCSQQQVSILAVLVEYWFGLRPIVSNDDDLCLFFFSGAFST